MGCNTITDLYLMAIPIPIIWKARLDTRTKISLLILFSLSWVVVIFGIVRCVTLVTTGEYEVSQSGPWSVRESFLAVLVSNAPVVVPLLKLYLLKLTSLTASSSKNQSYQLDSQDKRSKPSSGSHEKSRDAGKKKRFAHPLSLPTKWGSDEEITMDQQMTGTGGRDVDVDKNSHASAGYKESKETLEMDVDVLGRLGRYSTKVTGQAGQGRQGDLSRDIVVTREWEVANKF
ncbi:hypothetical protein N0V90_007749 [Kalmusia sp. IMI 367209]|nr:hypothetical protein N0V90_007749 [Kalmusia sp. IMI 367209]